MKKQVIAIGCAAFLLAAATPTLAQTKEEVEKKVIEKKKAKEEGEKKKEEQEIIIRKKGKDDQKYTIIVEGEKVTVNGKPLDELKDVDVIIRKHTAPRIVMGGPASPRFRSEDGPGEFFEFDLADEEGLANLQATGNKAFLGVSSEPTEGGAKIITVSENSAAEKAGLKTGDIISKVNDIPIENQEDLAAAIGKFKPEDEVTISYKRDGKAAEAKAKLGKNKSIAIARSYNFTGPRGQVYRTPQMPAMPDMREFEDGMREFEFDSRNGMRGQNLLLDLRRPKLGIKAQDLEEGDGVKVLEVNPESPAAKAGIKQGDIITDFDGTAIKNADELAEAARKSAEKPSVKVQLKRDGKAQTIEIKTPKRLKTANL
ncbi:MAG: PDZ domain-containing protein [Chitinophagaceae bacterium]|uniref:PDZ domain-containing protein n=1 Tax=unclassified Paraflavitalea TaxID=2798305 RepID=UPI003D3368DD|nr:PDZ domain-containing protein [Chitinophagaceae bacterium]